MSISNIVCGTGSEIPVRNIIGKTNCTAFAWCSAVKWNVAKETILVYNNIIYNN